MKLKLGTRGSKLALWQAAYVSGKLQDVGFETEIIVIKTKGDQILDRELSKMGGKGLFTAEIEEALEKNEIHLAIHSAKDVRSVLDEGFELIAFTEREKSNDVLVANKEISLNSKMTIGTSSTRRIAFLKHFFPNINVVPVRGNLQTRFNKLDEGNCDALMLAYAGVHRMGYDDHIVYSFEDNKIIPPVGQGSIAIESFNNNLAVETKTLVRKTLNHEPTEDCLLAERAFLKEVDGGCSIPVYAHAKIVKEEVQMVCGVLSLDGKKKLEFSGCQKKGNENTLGKSLANDLLNSGGRELLEVIRKEMHN